jgi:hypothetical protein
VRDRELVAQPGVLVTQPLVVIQCCAYPSSRRSPPTGSAIWHRFQQPSSAEPFNNQGVQMRRAAALAAVTGLALAAPAAASAHRTATKPEKSDLLSAAGQTTPARCIRADIATVVPGSRWGAFGFNPSARGCARYGVDGITIEYKAGRAFQVKWAGSSGYPKNVPRRIFNDLSHGLF